MVTMELDGKKTEVASTGNVSYSSVEYTPKPEEPTIKKPAPVIEKDSADKPKSNRGRPPKTEKARVKPEPVKLDPKDYTEALDGAVTGLWVATASIPYTTAYAVVLDANKQGLVSSLNAAANSNATAREYVEKYTGGGGSMWAVSLAVVGANMAMQSWQLAKDPELRKQMAEHQQGRLKDWVAAQGFQKELKVPDDDKTGS